VAPDLNSVGAKDNRLLQAWSLPKARN